MENQSARARGAEPTPEPAIPAILAAFDKYEVVGMNVAHGLKDVDDFILSLIRTPAFADKVNDMVVECGNSLYRPGVAPVLIIRAEAGGLLTPTYGWFAEGFDTSVLQDAKGLLDQLTILLTRLSYQTHDGATIVSGIAFTRGPRLAESSSFALRRDGCFGASFDPIGHSVAR